MGWLLLCLHVFLFHFPSFSSSSPSFNFLCHHHENSALLQFKSSFTISTLPWCDETLMKTNTWKNGSDCCSWHGVTCDTVSGHVIGLNLGCEGLTGTLQPNSTLFHLPHLQTLNLSHNQFYDTHFHSKFGGFTSLTHLDLSSSNSYSSFQGKVPPQISHLSKLISLHLSQNFELVWKESTLKRLVQNATNLKELFLDETDMSSIKLNSIDLLFNLSSSLVTLNLRNTGLRGSFKKCNLCLPSIQQLYMSENNQLEGHQVPELSCSSNFLRILDFSGNDFEGPIPPSFSNLTQLTSLHLNFNSLNGSISSLLLTLPSLISLHLSENEFTGELPISLSNLQHLISLDLSSNSFKGQIPDVFGGMTKLQHLDLSSNNLEGTIPSSLFNLNQLLTLDCSDNKLVGPLIKKISGFQKLTHLVLDNNLLNGTIPSSLFSLPCLKKFSLTNNRFTGYISAISSYSLEKLYLCDNKLEGNIPKSIFNLSNLTILCLSSNNLSGVVDFQHFSKLQHLLSLSLSYNTQLSLNIETNISYHFPQLIKLELSSLNLNKLPKFIGKDPTLSSLDMSNNRFTGRVPNWLLATIAEDGILILSQNMFTSIDHISTSSYQLGSLDLSLNLLQGELSASICNMSSLKFLNLAHNKLTGTIPQCLVSSSRLQVLDLQMNKFHGTLANKFSKDGKLFTLNLFGNRLEGRLPETLSQCQNLEVLNIGNNKLEDKFPDWLQSLQDLKVLVLRDNKLHGPISNLKINNSFPSLIIFDISGNTFSGPLPKAYIEQFETMKNVDRIIEDGTFEYIESAIYDTHESAEIDVRSNYYYSMSVTLKGINMPMVKIPKMLVSIDLSRNMFEGEIPNDIGELHSLMGLNLSHNRLVGHIPQSMGNLTNLEWLDLSSNMLIGMIPAKFTNLNSLEVLNLSNNHLVGEIPQGKQFNTFSNDSYEGNSELCGLPLSKKCGPEQQSPPASPNKLWNEEKFRFGWKPVAIGYGCGFVFGIGLGYCMFLIGRPRWLVMIFGGQPKRRVRRRRTRVRRTNGSTMNQMIQMS
ncbi:receptor-like protein 7 isoform X1 [Vicia villosa]|uniref:receptor-like protein 7 isoform X1 n=1 Tax=Vicia villosa TaxID=3911 RepID=UPI00273BC27E|nr:receptor-like protein 7 isoform X1 [Vicia villosa]